MIESQSDSHEMYASDANEIYGRNSLLKQLAIDGPKSAMIKQPDGFALINSIQYVKWH